MKKTVFNKLIIVLCIVLAVGFSVFCLHIVKSRQAGLISGSRQKATPVLKAVTRNRKDNKTDYSVIYDNGEIRKTEMFIPDNTDFLYADHNCYYSKVENGRIIVRLLKTKVTDSKGNKVEPDETAKALMKTLAKETEHDIFGLIIVIDNGNYYAFVEYNVNLWAPCYLYRYEKEEKTLTDLYCWDDVELIGIAECENEK